MNTLRYFIPSVAALLLVGCASKPKPVATGPIKLTAAEASRRIEAAARADKPSLAAGVPFDVTETTPAKLWDGMRAQTFRVRDGLYAGTTFALTADDAAEVGASFGGPGVVTMRVGDLDADGKPDLTVVSGAGSGVTRYEINVLDRPAPPTMSPVLGGPPEPSGPLRQRRVPFSYRDPVTFAPAEGGLGVRDDARGLTLGTLRDAAGRLTFEPAPDLPRGVRERFLEPRM